MNRSSDDGSSGGRTHLRPILLGLFISWLLVYMLGASFLAFWSACHPQRNAATAAAVAAADEWAAWTGQWQGWALYGPYLPTQSAFVRVELCWDGQAERLRSEYEPADVTNFVRPFGSSRLSIYESYLGLILWSWDAESAAREPQVWNARLAAHVARQWKAIEVYLRWRLEAFQRHHPDRAPPTEAILLGHIYRIAAPGEEPFAWSAPVEVPLARWRPGVTYPANQLPIETYNLSTHQFDPLPRQP